MYPVNQLYIIVNHIKYAGINLESLQPSFSLERTAFYWSNTNKGTITNN
jgi:hypothetical protein